VDHLATQVVIGMPADPAELRFAPSNHAQLMIRPNPLLKVYVAEQAARKSRRRRASPPASPR
jgi:hypothetical protein